MLEVYAYSFILLRLVVLEFHLNRLPSHGHCHVRELSVHNQEIFLMSRSICM